MSTFNPFKLRFGEPKFYQRDKTISCTLPCNIICRNEANFLSKRAYNIIWPNKWNSYSMTTCNENDRFSSKKGERIALEKAKRNAYNAMNNRIKGVLQEYESLVEMLKLSSSKYSMAKEKEIEIINKFKR